MRAATPGDRWSRAAAEPEVVVMAQTTSFLAKVRRPAA